MGKITTLIEEYLKAKQELFFVVQELRPLSGTTTIGNKEEFFASDLDDILELNQKIEELNAKKLLHEKEVKSIADGIVTLLKILKVPAGKEVHSDIIIDGSKKQVSIWLHNNDTIDHRIVSYR